MDTARRKQTLGPFASAALPAIWNALDRLGWNHADFARALGTTSATAARVLYGERGAGREIARRIDEALDLQLGILWGKPCPDSWKPHAHPKPQAPRARGRAARTARKKARRAAADDEVVELAATGTDG